MQTLSVIFFTALVTLLAYKAVSYSNLDSRHSLPQRLPDLPRKQSPTWRQDLAKDMAKWREKYEGFKDVSVSFDGFVVDILVQIEF